MSTRCNVLVKDSHDKLWFYRHSDGYPSCTAESLKTFLRWLLDGRIRSNASQSSGWLVVMGHEEYLWDVIVDLDLHSDRPSPRHEPGLKDSRGYADWKVGAYEPTVGPHGDIEFLYVIDVEKATIACYEPRFIEYSAVFDEDVDKPFHVITAENIDVPVGCPNDDEVA